MKTFFKLPTYHLAFLSQLIPTARLLLWLTATGLAVWVLIALFSPTPTVAPALPSQAGAQFQMDHSPEARLLGVETTGGLAAPSVNLLGIIANQQGNGAAVISIEGQPAQSKRVGQEVANGWILDEVKGTLIVLRRSGQRHQVSLPVPQADPQLLRKIPSVTAN